MNWMSLNSVDQLTDLIAASKSESTTFALFKHSTRCSISATAKARLERSWKESEGLPIFLLDLLNHRDVSSEIERVLEIQHESPQLLVIQNGKVIYHQSHLSISADEAQLAVV